MHFKIDEFSETLKGLTPQQACEMIALQQDKLMHEISQPRFITQKATVSRSLKAEIDFLNKLGNEIGKGLVVRSTPRDRNRIDKVLKSLNIQSA